MVPVPAREMSEPVIDWYLMNPCPYCGAGTWQHCRSVNPPHAPLKFGHMSRHHLVAWYRDRWMDDPQLRDWLSENGHLFTAPLGGSEPPIGDLPGDADCLHPECEYRSRCLRG